MALLRKIEHCVNGVQPAWEETFRNWEMMSKGLQAFSKSRLEDAQLEPFHRSMSKRRASHQNSEHDLEDQINEWANMTGFLCALGGVCLQRKSPTRPNAAPSNNTPSTSTSNNHNNLTNVVSMMANTSGTSNSSICSLVDRSAIGFIERTKGNPPVLPNSNAEMQYCPVTQFVHLLLRLLVCSNEKFGPQIQKHVQDLIGHEMSATLYPILFEQIKSIIDKFFDQQGQVIVNEFNTQFIEHIILIMKNILDSSRNEQPSEHLGVTSIEGMMLATVRYVRHLDNNVNAIYTKTKLCQLVEAMIKRRDDLAFRQEMKFRNKLVEYLTDWVMGTSHQIVPPQGTGDLITITR